MLQHPTSPSQVIDLSPQALADALDHLFEAAMETDREVAVILKTAREGLRNLSYNRWAATKTRESNRMALTRRLRAHAGWRPER